MGSIPREATPDEASWVLARLPEPQDPKQVSVQALAREDGTAWFWVYPRDVALGELYLTWVVERNATGDFSVGSFRSRRSERGDVTVP